MVHLCHKSIFRNNSKTQILQVLVYPCLLLLSQDRPAVLTEPAPLLELVPCVVLPTCT
jgi:hypothetical protein